MAARLALGAALAVNLLTLPLASQAATYSYTDLSPSGATESYGYGISGGQQVGYSGPYSNYHAFLWSGTASSAVDLNPVGFTSSFAYGNSGSQQVGYGSGSATGGDYNHHALLWSGTASSVVDLNPSGFPVSFAYGNSGSQQIGQGVCSASGNSWHALLWSGTASSAVDLNPSGFTESYGLGISGTQQVGVGSGTATGNDQHALLWSGTASSVVDLNPSGFGASLAYCSSGSQQVGIGNGSATGYSWHALLWSGTASSIVDLNPSGCAASSAYGTSGSQQVGEGFGSATGFNQHALLWSGTANSVVDLGSLLSSDYSDSYAEGIDANGNVVGWAVHIPTGQHHAILWTVVHESVVICNDPGQCGAVATYPSGASVTCSPASGSFFPVGITTVICTTTNPPGIPPATYTFTVTVKDCEPPVVSCRPVHKPAGKSSGKSDKDSEREENLDGFLQLLGHDNCDSNPRLYIQDSASGLLSGPFANGDIVKLTKKHGRQDPEDAKDSKIPHRQIVANVRLEGNGLLYGVDANGNVGASVLCRVPHGNGD